MPNPGADPVAAGKSWAMLSYAGIFIGVPLSVVPLIQKDNAYALYHAKHATGAWIIGMIIAIVVSIITVVTCGFGMVLFPLCFLPWATAIHGLMIANNGEWREPFGVFGTGEKFFGSIQPNAIGAGAGAGYGAGPYGGPPGGYTPPPPPPPQGGPPGGWGPPPA
jgi:hypothetical protein